MVTFKIKELEEPDLTNSFFETLGCLRSTGKLTVEKAKSILKKIKGNPNHKIFIAVDDGKIIGATTLLIEHKFIHEGGLVGHIEDVVTHRDFQYKGVGSALMKKAIDIARESGCYKVILDCSEDNAPFYEKAGFKKHGIEMRMDLK